MEPQLRTRERPEPPASDGPDSTTAPEGLTWAQRSLRMRTWISVMGALMCAFTKPASHRVAMLKRLATVRQIRCEAEADGTVRMGEG